MRELGEVKVAVLASREGGGRATRLELPAGEWRDPFSGETVGGGSAELNLEGGRLLICADQTGLTELD
ncbi:hypothetical protein [Deinococcus sp.]|uniref:hypothetical protein n=1 Tax=Deinococcus sp. TaxID=47478 RepID=UPI003C7C0074